MTKFCCHRINTIKELKNIPTKYGVELDLRDSINGNIHLCHDPFLLGEDFELFLQKYDHSFIILNIKSERIEWKILELLKKYNILNYFFLDCSFPMIYQLSEKNENKIALRFSEYEGLDTIVKMKDRVSWVWIDCFSHNPLTYEIYNKIKKLNLKICFVSPELQNQPKNILNYKEYFDKNNIKLDMICTKKYNIQLWN